MTSVRTPARPPVPARSRGRLRRRWYRAVVPFAVLAMLVGATVLARLLEEPNLRAEGTLSPAGTGQDGSSQLAGLLAERGVRIDHVTGFDEAVAAGETGEDSVVFIPKPTVFGAVLAALVPRFPGQHRVVMVAPSQRYLDIVGAPVDRDRPRWATRASEPGCTMPEAVAAGRAGALRERYRVSNPERVCYQGGLVQAPLGAGTAGAELFVVGSADPFRNRRIDEHHNTELALALLAGHQRVIWADALPPPPIQPPELGGGDRPEGPEMPELRPPPGRDLDRSSSSQFENMFYGYPPAMLVGLVLLALVALLVALVRARRLGPPVSEPLPVLVPAAEAVAGRGRLYQRARGRGAALDALRAAALRRLGPALGLPSAPPPGPDTVVAAVAARTGLSADYVAHTLYGPPPDTDQQLTQAVAALDALVEAVTHEGGAS